MEMFNHFSTFPVIPSNPRNHLACTPSPKRTFTCHSSSCSGARPDVLRRKVFSFDTYALLTVGATPVLPFNISSVARCPHTLLDARSR